MGLHIILFRSDTYALHVAINCRFHDNLVLGLRIPGRPEAEVRVSDCGGLYSAITGLPTDNVRQEEQ